MKKQPRQIARVGGDKVIVEVRMFSAPDWSLKTVREVRAFLTRVMKQDLGKNRKKLDKIFSASFYGG